ncbi:hypothetical protein M8818_001259 [Zalaria obscura]|uniref:Uncharacterized protein n=1 Tax=Zalaria obscura TaxID=2024903 RepID=A0ACC3SPU3_9PEZI
MAKEYMLARGFDLNAMLREAQFGASGTTAASGNTKKGGISDKTISPGKPKQKRLVDHFLNVSLPCTESGTSWDVQVKDGRIANVQAHDADEKALTMTNPMLKAVDGCGALLAPSLCHPHIHLDKAYLLSYPKFAHLQIEKGTFEEAMSLTNEAKANFEHDDLLERGHRVVDTSRKYGVTAMRAFVEVDPIVGMKCLTAGREIKEANEKHDLCDVQLCAFAQLALFSGEDGGDEIRRLMREACEDQWKAGAVGSTPYVEADLEKMKRNVEWMIELALEMDKHLDFHLDYNLDPETEPLVWYVVKALKEKRWKERTGKTVVLGHCTRLTLFNDDEWRRLKEEVGDLPISFVGLPTSDLYMMKTENGARGTLPVPKMIKEYGLNAAIGINNIGNAFTPQGSVDPLSTVSMGVGVYQAGTKKDAEILYECVSTRAKTAIGLLEGRNQGSEESFSLEVKQGQKADLVHIAHGEAWHTRKRISEAVYLYDGGADRQSHKSGGHTVERVESP